MELILAAAILIAFTFLSQEGWMRWISARTGGLAGAGPAMMALLLYKGVSLPDAVAAAGTVLIRPTTLWFAVALRIGVLETGRRREARK